MTQATKNTLAKFKNEINWTTEKRLPMSQGEAINAVISRYEIPAVRWGYEGSLIGVETKKQFMFWRDKGGTLEFKGLLDKGEANTLAKKTPAKKRAARKS